MTSDDLRSLSESYAALAIPGHGLSAHDLADAAAYLSRAAMFWRRCEKALDQITEDAMEEARLPRQSAQVIPLRLVADTLPSEAVV